MKCLVTAIGSMSAEAVISRLLNSPGIEVIGCNMHPAVWTPASRLVSQFYAVPSAKNERTYIDELKKICLQEQVTHVIPLTDPEVDVLSASHDLFGELGIVLCVSSLSAVNVARNKAAIYQRFAHHPRIQPIATANLQNVDESAFPWPWIAKPSCGRSSEGIVQIPDADALLFWRKRLVDFDYVVQPRLPGDVVVVDVVRQPRGGATVAIARQELLRTTNGAGLTVRMLPEHPCATLACEVAEALNISGCINVEFLMSEGKPLLMDVNPRFSAGVAFSVRAGYDMVTNHFRCFVNEKLDSSVIPPDVIYARGYIEYSLES